VQPSQFLAEYREAPSRIDHIVYLHETHITFLSKKVRETYLTMGRLARREFRTGAAQHVLQEHLRDHCDSRRLTCQAKGRNKEMFLEMAVADPGTENVLGMAR
jgi:hypothetical protein